MIFGFVMDTAAQEVTTDSVFVRNSLYINITFVIY